MRKLWPITIRFTAAGLVNAANYRAGPVAAEEIGTLFGEDLAPRSEVAAAGPVPVLAGGPHRDHR